MTAQPTLKRHPIRGFLWGIVMGLGVGLLLMVLSVVQLSLPMLAVYTAVVAVAGALWGVVGPPKKAKGPAPTEPPMVAGVPDHDDEVPDGE